MFSANNPPSLPSVDSADRQPAVQHNCEHQVAQPFSFLIVFMPNIKATFNILYTTIICLTF